MKNLIKIICLFFIFTLAGCSAKAQVVETTVKADTSKTFTVGFDAEYPPYGYLADNGDYTGFDLELAEEFCKRNNYTLVKKPIDWDGKDLELNSGNIDCIWNGFTVTGRENNYEWTIPYIDNSIVVVVKTDSNINTLEDLKEKIILVQQGSSGEMALESDDNKDLTASFKDLLTVPDYNSAMMQLEMGEVDAVVIDVGVAEYEIKGKENKFKILTQEINKEQYAVGFKLGNVELKNEVEKCLLDMYKDGTMNKIADKYSDYNIKGSICLK